MYIMKDEKEIIKAVRERLSELPEFDINSSEPFQRWKISSGVFEKIAYLLFENLRVEELRKIDLSELVLDYYDVRYKDLSYTNVNIDPQNVYRKSLFKTNLEGVDLRDKDFTGVDVRGAKIGNDGEAKAVFKQKILKKL